MKNALVYAISGTHSCGKTTTVNDVKNVLTWLGLNVQVGTEVARSCPYPLNEKGGFEGQEWIMNHQLTMEKRLRNTPADVILIDRTVVDHLAYAKYLYDNGRMYYHQYCKLENTVHFFISSQKIKYETVFYFDPLPLVMDGVRSPDIVYQKTINDEMKKMLKENFGPDSYIHVKETGRLDRAGRIVQDIISRMNYRTLHTSAIFYDVDGTLSDFDGTIKPDQIMGHPIFTGYVSIRNKETELQDQIKLEMDYGLTTLPIPYTNREQGRPYTDKTRALVCIRHCLKWISPLRFYYIGDKPEDAKACKKASWKYLTPKEYLERWESSCL